MPNHVHLVLVPSQIERLQCALRAVHGQYAQRINRMKGQKGHFWQGRFFSSPLDSDYFLNAVRYVELNPVRAGLVKKAEDYSWSSAPTHCGLSDDPVVSSRPKSPLFAGIASWSRWLAEGIAEESLAVLRKNCSQNLPCGSTEFVTRLENEVGRSLRFRSPGRDPEPH
jgi:putative transposase